MNAMLLVGGYTGDSGAGVGIEAVRAEGGSGLHGMGTAVAAESPTYLARHPRLEVVYAACEHVPEVRAFSARDGGRLLDPVGDAWPAGSLVCHVAVDPRERWLAASSYGSGVVHLYTLDENGAIVAAFEAPAAIDNAVSSAAARTSRAHAALALPDGRIATTDLGLDLLRIWSVDASDGARLALVLDQELALPAGSGPRMLDLHPSGAIFVITEYSIELIVVALTDDGATYALIGTYPVISGGDVLAEGDTGAHISIDAAAARVYVTVRQRNSLHTFGIADDGRTLHPLAEISTGGNWPRHHLQQGRLIHVANQLSNTVTTLALDAEGIPATLEGELAVGAPTCLLPL